MRPTATPTGVNRTFGVDQLIVSKTDLKGVITYANDVFLDVSKYGWDELVGQPHNIVRHPDTPRGLFKYLWSTISSGNEIFAYLNNLAKDGAHYWVLAHVTPTLDARGRVIGYHSNRRLPSADAIAKAEAVYTLMRTAESSHKQAVAAAEAGERALVNALRDRGVTYEEFVWDAINATEAAA